MFSQAFSAPIDVHRAKAFAKQFIQIDEEDFRAVNKDLEQGEKAYYIFNAKANNGFVIVSGDDCLPLLVGYADQGHINPKHLPIQLKSLLKGYEKQVQALRQTKKESFRSHSYFALNPKPIVAPLTKSFWGQDQPFNDDAPEMHDGVRAVVGCVATAMAQIMYYHQWPKKGMGAYSYIPKVYNKSLSVDFSQSTYDWGKMTDKYPIRYFKDAQGAVVKEPKYSAQSAKAVAKLMYDLAVSVSMDFNTSSAGGSSASTFNMAQALNKYFDYTTRNINRRHSSYNQFIQIIKRELKAKHPLVLSGAELDSGHAWVVDGYDENDYLHCNWGWDGVANGYYNLNFMIPLHTGVGAGFGRYNDDQSIVIIQPNKPNVNQTISSIQKLSMVNAGQLSYQGQNGASIRRSLPFSVVDFGNFDVKKFEGSVALGLYDEQGNFLETQGGYDKVELESNRYFSKFPTSLYLAYYTDDKFLIRLLSKQKGANDWQMVEGSNTLKAEIRGGKFYILEDNHELKFKLSQAPKEEAPVYTESVGVSSVVLENQSNQIVEGRVGIRLSQKESKQSYRLKLSPIKLYRFEKRKINLVYNLALIDNLEAGAYDVDFEIYTTDAGQDIVHPISSSFGTYTIEVLDKAKVPMLTCLSLDLEQNKEDLSSYHITPEMIKQGAITLKPVLKNTGTIDFDGVLKFSLKKLSDASSIDLDKVKTIRLDVGQETSAEDLNVELDLQSLKLDDGEYELHLLAENNGETFDVWNPRLRRHIFFWEQNKQIASFTELERGCLQVYPNPVSDKLYLRGVCQELAIYSMQGQRLLYLAPSQDEAIQMLDLSRFSQGVYILRYRNANVWESIRIYKR